MKKIITLLILLGVCLNASSLDEVFYFKDYTRHKITIDNTLKEIRVSTFTNGIYTGKVLKMKLDEFESYTNSLIISGFMETNVPPTSGRVSGFTLKNRVSDSLIFLRSESGINTPFGYGVVCDVQRNLKREKIIWLSPPVRKTGPYQKSQKILNMERQLEVMINQYNARLQRLKWVSANTPDSAVGYRTGHITTYSSGVGGGTQTTEIYSNPSMEQIRAVNRETVIVENMSHQLDTAKETYEHELKKEMTSWMNNQESEKTKELIGAAYYLGKYNKLPMWSSLIQHMTLPVNTDPPNPD